MLLCIVACRLSAFLAVWCGQTEREASLCNLKLHTARFRVAVGQLTDRGEAAAVRGQPVLQVGVVGADMDKGVFLVKPNIGGLFLLFSPVFINSPFCAPVTQ